MSREQIEQIKHELLSRLTPRRSGKTLNFKLIDDMSFVFEQLEQAYKYKETYEGVVRAFDAQSKEIMKCKDQNKRYREAIEKAIEDLENGCLWDALVRLKALEDNH